MVLFVGGFLNAKQVLSFRALSEICAKFALFFFLVRLSITVVPEEVTIGCELMMFMLPPIFFSSFSFCELTLQKEHTVQDLLLVVNNTKYSLP